MTSERNGKTKTVLFTGYAPVHFVCFLPMYRQLSARSDVEVFLSGGLRTKTESGHEYDGPALYEPFELPADRVLPVTEVRDRDFDFLFAANSNLLLPRTVGTKIQIFHGMSFRNKAIRLDNIGCDYYFVVGPYMRRRFAEARLLQERDPRVIPIGFMKTDRLLNGELNRNELLNRYGFAGDRPILLYAPTGAKGNSLETMGEGVIEKLCETGKYDLIVKPHDHAKHKNVDWFERLARFEGPQCRVTRERDVIPLAYLSDMLISDASSISNEYALLDRPMVFLDTPKLLERARSAESSQLDLDTWGRKGGTIVATPQEVVDVVEQGLASPREHSKIRRAMVQDLFYNPGTATRAALRWFDETLPSGPGAPDTTERG